MPYFLETGLSIAEILQFFDFPNGRKVLLAARVQRTNTRTTVPNFVTIGQSVVEILQLLRELVSLFDAYRYCIEMAAHCKSIWFQSINRFQQSVNLFKSDHWGP